LTRKIDASRDVVWRACGTLRGLAAWQADEVEGELEVGRSVSLGWPALGVSLELDVVELEPERLLLLKKGATRLSLRLHDGGVELEHSGVGDGDAREGVSASWQLSLGLLAHYCEAHGDARRTVRWLLSPARTTPEAAHVFFSHGDALATWLGAGPSVGPAGSRYELELGGAGRMSGSVLANVPGRDVALAWDEDGGSTVVLRTLPRPFDPELRLVVLSYSRWGKRAAEQARLDLLEAAHHRLVRVLDSTRSA
jgi:uncharacterized protein YndB with AHSA1/START domain